MEEIRVSIDRIIIEYTEVSLEFFNSYIARTLCDFYYKNINPNGSPAFHYTVCFKENKGHYLHLSYKLMMERKSTHYTLWAETNPEYMVTFKNVFKMLSKNANSINFVLADVAFDVPYALRDVLLVPVKGRKPSYCKTSTYYGKRKDCRDHGYCRFYDKKKQLKEKYGIEIEGERSRVEIAYRPDSKSRFSMRALLDRPPHFNRLYQCHVITDINKLKPKRKEMVQALLKREIIYREVSYYLRGELKKDLASQMQVDFNTLAEQQWKEFLNLYVSLAYGW